MLGTKDRWQEDLFMVGTLGDLVPEDHPLRKIDRRVAGLKMEND